MKKLKRNLKVFALLGMLVLLGCATEKQDIKDKTTQPLPTFSLYPIPFKDQTKFDEQRVRSEKVGIVIVANMNKIMLDSGIIYFLKIDITNLMSSILIIDPQKAFVRTLKTPPSFLERWTGEMVIELCRNRASEDYSEYLDKKSRYDALMSSQSSGLALYGAIRSHKKGKDLTKKLESHQKLKDFAEKNLLFPTQLPRAGSIQGGILFFPKDYMTGEDDLVVQFYVGGEEFVFRFVENIKTSPPDLELIIDVPPPEEI